jgi:hypothetical protein
MDPPFKLPDGDFTKFVPHLRSDANVANLDKAITGDFPSGKFMTFFEFNGGILTARPCTNQLTLKYENGTKTIPAAAAVTLTGTTSTPAILEVSGRFKGKLEFNSNTVKLVLDNKPDKKHEKDPHFHLHKKVGDGSDDDKYPSVVQPAPPCVGNRGVTVACGNTQWP